MTTEQLQKANSINNDILGIKARLQSTQETTELVRESITNSGSVIFPLICPLTGNHLLVSTMELKNMYEEAEARLTEKLSDLEFEFKEL